MLENFRANFLNRSVFGILTFCFAEFDTSVICHAVFMLCSGSFLLQNMSKCWLPVRGTKFEVFREHETENHKLAVMLRVSVGGL